MVPKNLKISRLHNLLNSVNGPAGTTWILPSDNCQMTAQENDNNYGLLLVQHKNNFKQIVPPNFTRSKNDKKRPNPWPPWLIFCRRYHHHQNGNSGGHINSMPLQPSNYISQNPRKTADTDGGPAIRNIIIKITV